MYLNVSFMTEEDLVSERSLDPSEERHIYYGANYRCYRITAEIAVLLSREINEARRY